MGKDWIEWYGQYADADSRLSRRLAVVQARIKDALDLAAPGPIRAVSMCAGDGRDLLGVLADHPRRPDVQARLVELHPDLVAGAQSRAWPGIDVVRGDAGELRSYAGAVPADLVLVCGVLGNVSDEDVAGTVAALPRFTVPGGTVVWTRTRKEPDLVPAMLDWFAAAGFEHLWLSDKSAGFGVGVHRYTGPARPWTGEGRLFTFIR